MAANETDTDGRYDVAIVGGGAAGLHVALEVAALGGRACLISRKPLSESSSFWAQGGLAAALAPDDSPARHAVDTLNAGRGLCRHEAVAALTEEAPRAVALLQERGVTFDLDADGGLALGLEGGHSARRIVHAGGAQTGRAITSRLASLVNASEGIAVLDETSATALWSDGERCHGVITDGGEIKAAATVLATGGGAALWRRTTNPFGAIGAGLVLAHAAGAALADLEFCQFHPTALALPGSEADGTLVTEAVRGEGALLLDASERRFTDELAPRDQVSAAILDRMDADGTDHVWLDMRDLDPARFPSVFEAVRAAGIDPAIELVPVSPASHYLIGGILTDLHGRTRLPGLYAVGECSCTGLHGANRLASNSLTECFTFGSRTAASALDESSGTSPPPRPEFSFTPPTLETRAAVWAAAGPRRAAETLEPLLEDPYPLARLLARAALAREETRGPHQRTDHPSTDPGLDHQHLVVDQGGDVTLERWDDF